MDCRIISARQSGVHASFQVENLRTGAKSNLSVSGKLQFWNATTLTVETPFNNPMNLVTYDGSGRQVRSEFIPRTPSPPKPPRAEARASSGKAGKGSKTSSSNALSQDHVHASSAPQASHDAPRKGGCTKVALLAVGAFIIWQWDVISPILRTSTDMASEGARGQETHSEEAPVDKPQAASIKTSSLRPDAEPAPPMSVGLKQTSASISKDADHIYGDSPAAASLVFSDLIAEKNVAKALTEALSSGKPVSWHMGGRQGYALVSTPTGSDGERCRAATISERIDGTDAMSDTRTFCEQEGEWQ